MKKIIYSLALLIFASTVFTSCNLDVKKANNEMANIEKTQRNLEHEKEEYSTQFKIFRLETEEKISANDKSIEALKEKSKEMKKDQKIEYKKTINELERRNEVMRAKMAGCKEEEKEEWLSFKREFIYDMQELEQALTDITKNNRK